VYDVEAIECDGDDIPPADLVIEVHEAARELIRATGTKDLRAAYDVIDRLALEIKRAYPAMNRPGIVLPGSSRPTPGAPFVVGHPLAGVGHRRQGGGKRVHRDDRELRVTGSRRAGPEPGVTEDLS
jgi:hypothetical protein